MLGADVMIAHHTGLFDSQFDNSFRAGGKGRFAKRGAFPTPDGALHRAHNLARLHAQLLQHLHRDAVLFLHETEEQMLGADMIVIKPKGLFLSKR